jgi:ApbE superfamily uncharacterized protein (UPF0280 family)
MKPRKPEHFPSTPYPVLGGAAVVGASAPGSVRSYERQEDFHPAPLGFIAPAAPPLTYPMIRHHYEFRETIVTILAEEEGHVAACCDALLSSRQQVERAIAADPFFRISFEPYPSPIDEPVLDRMCSAAESAGVGPMAAVAGAIAWAGAEAMRAAGADFGIVDNGGDIALFTDREITIGIHAGASPLSDRFAFLIPPQEGILGCCTSSATVGPSISLGIADSVTVFSPDVALADAWATAVCNTITPGDIAVLDHLDGSRVTGVYAIIGNWTSSWGRIPRLVRARVDGELITAGQRLRG